MKTIYLPYETGVVRANKRSKKIIKKLFSQN